MNQMNAKKTYIWKLADFLCQHEMRMSGQELADHLNRNGFLAGDGTEFAGGQGTFRLISVTWEWLHEELGLPEEARKVAEAYVTKAGGYAYKVGDG